MVLYINACVRNESRTNKLAKHLLEKLGEYEEVRLSDINLTPLDEVNLIKRTKLIEMGDYSNPMFDLAKQFASADVIVMSAPFWDLSFPTILKTYIENIYITGIVSKYDNNGMPQGMCKAKKLYYVTTAGGPYNGKYSYEYIKSLAQDFFGISETELIKAEMLDVDGFDAEAILEDTIKNIYGFIKLQ